MISTDDAVRACVRILQGSRITLEDAKRISTLAHIAARVPYEEPATSKDRLYIFAANAMQAHSFAKAHKIHPKRYVYVTRGEQLRGISLVRYIQLEGYYHNKAYDRYGDVEMTLHTRSKIKLNNKDVLEASWLTQDIDSGRK